MQLGLGAEALADILKEKDLEIARLETKLARQDRGLRHLRQQQLERELYAAAHRHEEALRFHLVRDVASRRAFEWLKQRYTTEYFRVKLEPHPYFSHFARAQKTVVLDQVIKAEMQRFCTTLGMVSDLPHTGFTPDSPKPAGQASSEDAAAAPTTPQYLLPAGGGAGGLLVGNENGSRQGIAPHGPILDLLLQATTTSLQEQAEPGVGERFVSGELQVQAHNWNCGDLPYEVPGGAPSLWQQTERIIRDELSHLASSFHDEYNLHPADILESLDTVVVLLAQMLELPVDLLRARALVVSPESGSGELCEFVASAEDCERFPSLLQGRSSSHTDEVVDAEGVEVGVGGGNNTVLASTACPGGASSPKSRVAQLFSTSPTTTTSNPNAENGNAMKSNTSFPVLSARELNTDALCEALVYCLSVSMSSSDLHTLQKMVHFVSEQQSANRLGKAGFILSVFEVAVGEALGVVDDAAARANSEACQQALSELLVQSAMRSSLREGVLLHADDDEDVIDITEDDADGNAGVSQQITSSPSDTTSVRGNFDNAGGGMMTKQGPFLRMLAERQREKELLGRMGKVSSPPGPLLGEDQRELKFAANLNATPDLKKRGNAAGSNRLKTPRTREPDADDCLKNCTPEAARWALNAIMRKASGLAPGPNFIVINDVNTKTVEGIPVPVPVEGKDKDLKWSMMTGLDAGASFDGAASTASLQLPGSGGAGGKAGSRVSNSKDAVTTRTTSTAGAASATAVATTGEPKRDDETKTNKAAQALCKSNKALLAAIRFRKGAGKGAAR
eukprot:g7772.t1